MKQNICDRTWAPQLSIRPPRRYHAMLSYLDPTLGCPMLGLGVSLRMNLEEYVCYEVTLYMTPNHLPPGLPQS